MKSKLIALLGTTFILSSCGDVYNPIDVVWSTNNNVGLSITKYAGTLDASVSLDTAINETQYSDTTFSFDQSLELRKGDQFVINLSVGHGLNFTDYNNVNDADKKYLKFEDRVTGLFSSRLAYCPDQEDDTLKPNYDNGMFRYTNDGITNIAHLATMDPKKINKEIVDVSMLYAVDSNDTVTDEEYKTAADNYNIYLDSLLPQWKNEFLNCKDIGKDKTFETIEAWFKASNWNQPAILMPGNEVTFKLKDDKLAFIVTGESLMSDYGSIALRNDANDTNLKYLSPNLGINLDKGSSYLKSNWSDNALNNGGLLVGKYNA